MVDLDTILAKYGIGQAPELPTSPTFTAAAEQHRTACLAHLASARAALGIVEACLSDAPDRDDTFAAADSALAHKLRAAQVELQLFRERRECMGEA